MLVSSVGFTGNCGRAETFSSVSFRNLPSINVFSGKKIYFGVSRAAEVTRRSEKKVLTFFPSISRHLLLISRRIEPALAADCGAKKGSMQVIRLGLQKELRKKSQHL